MEKSDLHEDENSLKNKKLIFNVEEIINKCKEKDGIELLNYMCSIMKEKKRNILETLYKELGKDYLIFNLEKALNIENSGGLNKGKCMYPKKDDKEEKNDNIKNNNDNNDSANEKKSTGGIFFSLVKKDPEAKNILNRATRKDFKESKQRKKVYKLMDKLDI